MIQWIKYHHLIHFILSQFSECYFWEINLFFIALKDLHGRSVNFENLTEKGKSFFIFLGRKDKRILGLKVRGLKHVLILKWKTTLWINHKCDSRLLQSVKLLFSVVSWFRIPLLKVTRNWNRYFKGMKLKILR